MEVVIYIALVLLGLIMGSFAGATVWRVRARELEQDKQSGEAVDKTEYKRLHRLTTHRGLHDRSRCLSCGHELGWTELIPLVSWLAQRGRCRHCQARIGVFEPLIELGMVAFFVLSYALWPYGLANGLEIARLVVWLLSGVVLAMLFSYDFKWFLLPNRLVIAAAVGGLATVAIVAIDAGSGFGGVLLSTLGSLAILGGLYGLIYVASRGQWVGFGDVKLGFALALLLADWRLAFIALFAANVIGCLIVIPGLLTGRLNRRSHVPFGPLLILGAVVALLVGLPIVDFYSASFVGVSGGLF